MHEIENAKGSRINLDYYSAKITTLPTVGGQQLTIDELFNYIQSDPDNKDDQDLFEEVSIGNEGDFNHTSGTYANGSPYTHAQVLRSSPNSQIGSAIAIPVGVGDKITASVFAKYIATAQDNSVPPTTLAAALIGAFTGSSPGSTEGGTGTINNNFGDGSLIGTAGLPYEDSSAPKAYLNLMFLPEGQAIDLVKDATFAYDQIASGATESVINGTSDSQFDELRIENFEAPQNGYILVYVSNEGSLTDVYFDDLDIQITESPIVQVDNYYPFGLTFNSYQRVTTERNKFKYNGFEEQTELDWNVYDYKARYYDPAIGRFLNIDPAADLMRRHSPYNYAFDNPIRFIDPDGMIPNDKVDPPKHFKGSGRRDSHGKVHVRRFTTAERVSTNISIAVGSIVPGVGVGFGIGAEYAKAASGMDNSAVSATATEGGLAFAKGFTAHGAVDGMVGKEMNAFFAASNAAVKGAGGVLAGVNIISSMDATPTRGEMLEEATFEIASVSMGETNIANEGDFVFNDSDVSVNTAEGNMSRIYEGLSQMFPEGAFDLTTAEDQQFVSDYIKDNSQQIADDIKQLSVSQ